LTSKQNHGNGKHIKLVSK